MVFTSSAQIEQHIAVIAKNMKMEPAAVMCQGEFTFVYSLVRRLKEKKVVCLAACSERMVADTADGKIVRFEFVKFREYLN